MPTLALSSPLVRIADIHAVICQAKARVSRARSGERASHHFQFAGNLERSAIQNSRLRLPRGQFDHSRHYESAACTLGNAPLSELTYGQADKAVVS
jgi:hypothetical protein